MIYFDIADKLVELKNADLSFREKLAKSGQLDNSYNTEMAEIHNENAKYLSEIIDKIGYPTVDKVGKEASQAAWLIIQHAIGQPIFMKKCAELLKKAIAENKADPKNLAYLTDRIAVFEGKAQLYGTQFDWDKNGKMNPRHYDDITKVNQRRKALGFNTLEEQTLLIKEQVKMENGQPPIDYKEKVLHYDKWRKSVGWIT